MELAPILMPLAAGVAAGFAAWFFESSLKDFIDQSPWVIPLLSAFGVTGVIFWLMMTPSL
jgi:hypothetical protein